MLLWICKQMTSEDDKCNIKNAIKNVDERKVIRERERKK